MSELKYCLIVSCLVMLITGGYDSDGNVLNSVELYGEEFQCKMNASMNDKRSGHASPEQAPVVCGGGDGPTVDSLTTCETMDTTTGVWRRSHTLNQERVASVMWRTRLMGGWYSSGTTTEVLQDDGSSENSFSLPHDTWYVDMCL